MVICDPPFLNLRNPKHLYGVQDAKLSIAYTALVLLRIIPPAILYSLDKKSFFGSFQADTFGFTLIQATL